MRFLGNIKVKLTSWYLVIVAILVALFGFVGYFTLANGLARNLVTPWDMRMADVTNLPDGTGRVTGFTTVTGQIGAGEGYSMIQIPLSGLIDSASSNDTIEIKALGSKPILVDKAALTDPGSPSLRQMWAYLFVSRDDPTNRRLVVAAQSDVSLSATLGLFQRTMLISAAVTLCLAAIVGFFLIWLYLRPLQAITQTLQKIGGKQQGRRLNERRSDELGQLASAVNQTFDRVDAALEMERQVTSDISHELKTPLALAQAQASLALTRPRSEVEYQKALETVSREITHLSSVTDRLLFLARSENGNGVIMAELDLKELAMEIASDAEVLCERKGIGFRANLSDDVDFRIWGDNVRLREMLLNLLDNAVHYTPVGGSVVLSLDKTSGDAAIAVSDTGIGISAEHLPHLFERFYRVDKSSSASGNGLGLAICKRIAELHGGRIEVQSQVGKGSTFKIFLPASDF